MAFEHDVETWSRTALDQDWVSSWVEGSIFPCEMVFFLARCETMGVRTVVESGRQDGYSTGILGELALRSGVRVVSIDLEEDEERAERCRTRLSRYPVELVRGNAFAEVPRSAMNAAGPVALLIDGPKGWPALAMAYACASRSEVAVLSLHNLNVGTPMREQFATLSGGRAFYEDELKPGPASWQELRSREQALLGHGARSLEKSSLGVMIVDDRNRAAVAGTSDGHFGFNQPAVLRAGWSLGLYGATRYLFSLSARLLKS